MRLPLFLSDQEELQCAPLSPAGNATGLWTTEAELQRLLRIQAGLPTMLQEDAAYLAGETACNSMLLRLPYLLLFRKHVVTSRVQSCCSKQGGAVLPIPIRLAR